MSTSHSVLIVEDDAGIRDVFGEVLRTEGHEVSLAANGDAAMKLLLDGSRPCVMIVDLLMPGTDGWELADRVGADRDLASIPFVVMSAQSDRGGRGTPPRARERLTKPLPLDQLLAAVARNCGGNRASRSRRPARRKTAGPV